MGTEGRSFSFPPVIFIELQKKKGTKRTVPLFPPATVTELQKKKGTKRTVPPFPLGHETN